MTKPDLKDKWTGAPLDDVQVSALAQVERIARKWGRIETIKPGHGRREMLGARRLAARVGVRHHDIAEATARGWEKSEDDQA